MDKFIEYCTDGNLIKAKKYYEENQNIDIHAKNEEAFRWSCYNGCGV